MSEEWKKLDTTNHRYLNLIVEAMSELKNSSKKVVKKWIEYHRLSQKQLKMV